MDHLEQIEKEKITQVIAVLVLQSKPFPEKLEAYVHFFKKIFKKYTEEFNIFVDKDNKTIYGNISEEELFGLDIQASVRLRLLSHTTYTTIALSFFEGSLDEITKGDEKDTRESVVSIYLSVIPSPHNKVDSKGSAEVSCWIKPYTRLDDIVLNDTDSLKGLWLARLIGDLGSIMQGDIEGGYILSTQDSRFETAEKIG